VDDNDISHVHKVCIQPLRKLVFDCQPVPRLLNFDKLLKIILVECSMNVNQQQSASLAAVDRKIACTDTGLTGLPMITQVLGNCDNTCLRETNAAYRTTSHYTAVLSAHALP